MMGNTVRYRLAVAGLGLVLGLGGCGWVDDTGSQENVPSEISLDETNQLTESATVTWPMRRFDPDNNILSLSFEQVDSGVTVAGCAAEFVAADVAPSLRDACQPSLSDAECSIEFVVERSQVSFELPALRRPAALQYEVKVVDEDGAQDTQMVDLCVATLSEPPEAVADSYSVSYLGAMQQSGALFDELCAQRGGTGVLANDRDDFDYREGWASGQSCLRVQLLEAPLYAAEFELDEDGGFRYVSSGAAGPGSNDQFTYSVSDGSRESQAAVSIQITGDNDAPLGLDPVLETVEDSSLDIAFAALANDPEGTRLRIERIGQPNDGTLQLIETGLRFVPDANFHGQSRFSVVLADAAGLTVSSEVRVDVAQRNDLPEFARLPDAFVLAVDDPLAPGDFSWSFQISDEETAAQQLVVTLQTDATRVSGDVIAVDGSGAAEVRLTPVSDGVSSVTLVLQDGAVGSLAANRVERTIPVTVTGMNQAPVAVDDAVELFKNEGAVLDVLLNDIDPDGAQSALRITSIVEAPEQGQAEIAADGQSIAYSPVAGFSGLDALSYRVSDGEGGVAEAGVVVTVVNRAPVVVGETYSMLSNDIAYVNVLLNDRDPDGDAMSVVLSGTETVGRASVDGGTVRYSPQSGFVGLDTVVYTVSDGDGGSSEGRIVIRVSSQSSER